MLMNNEFRTLEFTGRGCAALYIILSSINVRVKRILLPVNICEIIYPIVVKAGFEVVFYDVDMKSGNGCLEQIKTAYTGRESVLLAVHNFGLPVAIDSITSWSRDNGIFVIEDVCNAYGGKFKGRSLGSWGDAAIFSFGYAKILENGVGGAFSIKDDIVRERALKISKGLENFDECFRDKDKHYQRLINQVRVSSDHDKSSQYMEVYFSYVDYLIYSISASEVSSIIALDDSLKDNLRHREEIANVYRANIVNNIICHVDKIEGQVFWRYNILVPRDIRDDLISYLRDNGVLASRWYPTINKLFDSNEKKKCFPCAEHFASRVINLFVDQRVDISKAIYTCKLINEFN